MSLFAIVLSLKPFEHLLDFLLMNFDSSFIQANVCSASHTLMRTYNLYAVSYDYHRCLKQTNKQN